MPKAKVRHKYGEFSSRDFDGDYPDVTSAEVDASYPAEHNARIEEFVEQWRRHMRTRKGAASRFVETGEGVKIERKGRKNGRDG